MPVGLYASANNTNSILTNTSLSTSSLSSSSSSLSSSSSSLSSPQFNTQLSTEITNTYHNKPNLFNVDSYAQNFFKLNNSTSNHSFTNGNINSNGGVKSAKNVSSTNLAASHVESPNSFFNNLILTSDELSMKLNANNINCNISNELNDNYKQNGLSNNKNSIKNDLVVDNVDSKPVLIVVLTTPSSAASPPQEQLQKVDKTNLTNLDETINNTANDTKSRFIFESENFQQEQPENDINGKFYNETVENLNTISKNDDKLFSLLLSKNTSPKIAKQQQTEFG